MAMNEILAHYIGSHGESPAGIDVVGILDKGEKVARGLVRNFPYSHFKNVPLRGLSFFPISCGNRDSEYLERAKSIGIIPQETLLSEFKINPLLRFMDLDQTSLAEPATDSLVVLADDNVRRGITLRTCLCEVAEMGYDLNRVYVHTPHKTFHSEGNPHIDFNAAKPLILMRP